MTTHQKSVTDRLLDVIDPLLTPLGYEVVRVEALIGRDKKLRIFIDHAEGDLSRGIGIEDCVKVSHALDEPLDQSDEVNAIFKGAYELEVSSPGVDRPLRTEKDFRRFAGKPVRVYTFRALTELELGNSDFQAKHPKQKSFFGTLIGVRNDKVVLQLSNLEKKGKRKKEADRTSEVEVPLALICKAHLEPVFDFESIQKG